MCLTFNAVGVSNVARLGGRLNNTERGEGGDVVATFCLVKFIYVIQASRYLELNDKKLSMFFCRWIIQKAFYYPKTIGKCGCSGISWRNLFLFCPSPDESMMQTIPLKQALTLDDLDDLTPTYIGCTTVNRWKRTPSLREPQYEVLTMSPHGIERLDRPRDEQGLHGKFMPVDVLLSEVAANSAAAVNYDAGPMLGDEAPVRSLLVMMGLSFGASVVAEKRHRKNRPICVKVTFLDV